jgi:aspartyl-tRNA(Asn)/glutamyl-tRNA(Gln) amidotransferase subunit B
MRSKEEAHDYRYFPDPDLPPLVVDGARLEAIRAAMPVLPAARRRALQDVHGLSEADAVTLTQQGLDGYFEETVAAGAAPKSAKNWLLGAVRATMNDEGLADAGALRGRLAPARLAELLALADRGAISGPIAKDVFEKMWASGRAAGEIVAAEGLAQIDDASAIQAIVADVLAANADAVAQYRSGKTNAFGFLVGQVMRAAGGKTNPKRVNELLKQALGS